MDKVIKVLIGAACTVSGIMLFGFVHLAVGNYLPNISEWSNPPGKYLSALNQIWGTIPAIIGIVLFIIGLNLFVRVYKTLE